MRGLPNVLSFLRNEFNQFNYTRALMLGTRCAFFGRIPRRLFFLKYYLFKVSTLDSIYHRTLESLKHAKTRIFGQEKVSILPQFT